MVSFWTVHDETLTAIASEISVHGDDIAYHDVIFVTGTTLLTSIEAYVCTQRILKKKNKF